MSEADKEQSEMKELYEKLFSKGVGMGIIMALYIYETLNLKKIATLIGKLETTTLNQVKKLLEEGFIEVDSKATARSRGTYYKLTDLTKKLLKTPNPDEELTTEKIKKFTKDDIAKEALKSFANPDFDKILTQVKMVTSINSYIEKFTIQSMEELYDQIKDLESEEEKIAVLDKSLFPIGTFSFRALTVVMKNFDQMSRYISFLDEMGGKLKKLNEDFEEENKGIEDPEFETFQYVYMFNSPLWRDIDSEE